MASLMSHHKGRGEAILMVQGAAADRVAHPRDRSIAWEETEGGSSLRAWSLTPRQPQTGPSPRAVLQN